MSQPKTDYDPDNYNPNSFANIMQFITADIMVREDREGYEGLMKTNEEVVKIRKKIEAAYRSQREHGPKFVPVQCVAEGVLLWMREGATLKQVLKCGKGKLLKKGRRVSIK